MCVEGGARRGRDGLDVEVGEEGKVGCGEVEDGEGRERSQNRVCWGRGGAMTGKEVGGTGGRASRMGRKAGSSTITRRRRERMEEMEERRAAGVEGKRKRRLAKSEGAAHFKARQETEARRTSEWSARSAKRRRSSSTASLSWAQEEPYSPSARDSICECKRLQVEGSEATHLDILVPDFPSLPERRKLSRLARTKGRVSLDGVRSVRAANGTPQ